mgnify:CR=1 FL=1
MNILVTGSDGFIGKSLVRYLRLNTSHNVFEFSRRHTFEDLEKSIFKIDKVFHFAGSNQWHNINELEKVNISLTRKLCGILKKNSNIELYFGSSIQVFLKNPYGESKKNAEDICLELERVFKNRVYILRLPGIFGSGCKPNYNSVVATFCYNVSNNYPLKIINPNKVIDLIFVDDLCEQLNDLIIKSDNEQFIKMRNKYKISIKELAKSIKEFGRSSNNPEKIKKMGPLKNNLYKTYLSFK